MKVNVQVVEFAPVRAPLFNAQIAKKKLFNKKAVQKVMELSFPRRRESLK
jgi:hypothetical protein